MAQPRLNILMVSHHKREKSFARSHAIGRQLVNKGHRVTLIVTADKNKASIAVTDWDGVRLVEAPDLLWGRARSGWDPWNTGNRIRFLMQDPTRYDVIHAFETRPATIHPLLLYLRKSALPLVIDWNDWWGRGGIIQHMRPWLWRVLMGGLETYYEEHYRTRAFRTTTISTALAQRATNLGVPSSSVTVVPGGVDLGIFKSIPIAECRLRTGVPQDAWVIGFSSLDSFYDLENVVNAVKQISTQHPDTFLLMTGHVPVSVLELIEQNGLNDHLIATGYVPYEDLHLHLGCANVFVLPLADTLYNKGKWPNKLGEYMAVGRPTIANPVGDVEQVFSENEIGLLCGYDSGSFVKALLAVLEDPDRAKYMGSEARDLAQRKYDWKILSEVIESIYIEAIETYHRA